MTEERFYDKNGVPIYPGDLLRTYHFTGARRKRYWLYHVVVDTGHKLGLQMIPASHLEPSLQNQGGCAYLKHMHTDTQSVVISGHGPGDILGYEDRPKRKQPAHAAAKGGL